MALLAATLLLAIALSAPLLGRAPELAVPSRVPAIPWWVMAILFYLFELSVVHFRFRRDAHSFSISEIATVIGVYLADPFSLLLGQMLGAGGALVFNRKQRGVRLVFNVATFGIQTLIVAGVFFAMVNPINPLGPRGAAGVFLGSLLALGVASLLISTAIRVTGGQLRKKEVFEVISVGSAGTLMNVGLGLVAVTILWSRPQSAWLAFLPVALLFVAFRAYTGQRDARSRIEALYELTFDLHGSPILEDAIRVAAEGTRELFEANTVHIILIPEKGHPYALRSTATADAPVDLMTPISLQITEKMAAGLERPVLYHKLNPDELVIPGVSSPRTAMVVPLVTSDGRNGVLIVADPLSAVSGFNDRDLRLAETVANRLTVSLENGRLEDSLAELTKLKERLEALIRSKDQFLASVSHELRTPLTGIVGLAQELTRDDHVLEDGEAEEFLGLIYEQSSELANIVEDLLVAARADIGTLVIKPRTVELSSELAPVLASHARKDGRGKIIPQVRCTGEAMALTDPLRLRQIMRNLLSNAVRYGGQQVWVEIERRAEKWAVVVADDGAGVPPDAAESIFNPYTRASNSVVVPQSVGLGLSVSRQLARLLDGDLTYERANNVTRFVLLLPAAN